MRSKPTARALRRVLFKQDFMVEVSMVDSELASESGHPSSDLAGRVRRSRVTNAQQLPPGYLHHASLS